MEDIYQDFVSKGRKVHNININDMLVTNEWIWLLGLMWADGCVSGKRYSLELKETDFLGIWPILEAIGFNTYSSRTRKEKYKQCSITSTQGAQTFIYLDFKNKSKSPPTKLWNMLTDKQRWIFLRGFFEGDGSYSTYGKRKDGLPKLITINGSVNYDYDFLIDHFIHHEIPTNKIIRTTRIQHDKQRSYSIIAWTNQEHVYKIFKKLYECDPHIALPRKQTIALDFIKNYESGKILLRDRSIIIKSLATKASRLLTL